MVERKAGTAFHLLQTCFYTLKVHAILSPLPQHHQPNAQLLPDHELRRFSGGGGDFSLFLGALGPFRETRDATET